MRARLFSRVGETKGADFEIESAATIGRHPDNEVVLEPSLVSSRHARITYDAEGGRYVLEDLESLNGTALDGHRVAGRERLGHLHVITFAGKHDFIFQDLQRCAARHGAGAEPTATSAAPEERRPEEKTSIEKAPVALPGFLAGGEAPEADAPPEAGRVEERTSIERSPVALPDLFSAAGTAEDRTPEAPETEELLRPPDEDLAAVPAGEAPAAEVLELLASGGGKATFHLELVDPEGGIERVELVDGENLLGRGDSARIRPDNLDISRRHAVLTVAGGRVTLRDLGSRNHTYLEGERVSGEVEVSLESRLRFGRVEARLLVQTED